MIGSSSFNATFNCKSWTRLLVTRSTPGKLTNIHGLPPRLLDFLWFEWQEGLVDYCVTIDAGARIIIDSTERWPMVLSEEVLKLCGGSNARNLRVGEIRKVVKQREANSILGKRGRGD